MQENTKDKEKYNFLRPTGIETFAFIFSAGALQWLHGTTTDDDGREIGNFTLFGDLLARMALADGTSKGFHRPLMLSVGQAQYSEEQLSTHWNMGRKRIRRLLDGLERLELIDTCRSRVASVMTFPCLLQWMAKDGSVVSNPFIHKQREKDKHLAETLRNDPKENAEHVMLVDLARNDLSRNCHNVKVDFYKETQYYSHVIHLVSRVSGQLHEDADPIKTFIDTFPAGTLSGAPKIKAMQLINEYEPHSRGAYGGCIGFIGFNGNLNQAITIRTFVSRNNELWFQAGGGIVAQSNVENELQEVNNKLGALKKAIEIAEQL